MRHTGDFGGRHSGWLAIGLKSLTPSRVQPMLKLCSALLVTGLCITVYLAFAPMRTSPSSKSQPMVNLGHSRLISSLQGGLEPEENAADGEGAVMKTYMERMGANIPPNEGQLNDVNSETLNIDEAATLEKKEEISPNVVPTQAKNSSEYQKDVLYYDRIGIAPKPCGDGSNVSELLQWPVPEFLPEYKNPCWRERLEDPYTVYKDNKFAEYSVSYKKILRKLEDIWQEKAEIAPVYRLRCLPYFFLAGQPKSGSTDLYKRLTSHPDIATPPTKEPHWWGKFRFGKVPFSDYVDLFDDAGIKIDETIETVNNSVTFHPVITGDASVSTLWSNDGWWKHSENCGVMEPRYTNAHYIHRLLPGAKILIILRNPTDRLYSDFLYFHESAKSQEVFHKEVQRSIDHFKACVEGAGLRSCLYNYTVSSMSRVRLRVGLYALYLDEWLALFPRDQIYVIRLEDYSATPLTTIKKVHKFLDLRTLTSDENVEVLEKPKANTRRKEDQKLGRMYPKTQKLLDQFYRPFNQKLAKTLGDDRFLWTRDSSLSED